MVRIGASLPLDSQPHAYRAEGEAPDPSRPCPNFEQIYEGHFQMVWRTLRRLGVPPPQLEDAAQDVFVVVHRRLPEFEGRSSLKTWIFGITIRVAGDWLRRGRRRPTEELPAALPARSEGPLDQVARAEALSVLHALLEELSPEHRVVFVLAELEELTIPQIAEVLQRSRHTVKSRLQVARNSFDAALHRHHARDRWRQP